MSDNAPEFDWDELAEECEDDLDDLHVEDEIIAMDEHLDRMKEIRHDE